MIDAKEVRDHLWWFFAERTDGFAAALFRILYGSLAVWTAIGVGLNLDRYYGPDGMIPWSIVADWRWSGFSLFAIDPTSELILGLHFWLFLLASLLFLFGLFARPAAFVIFALSVSMEHRNPFIVNSGDRLFLILAFYAMLMPLSHQWSVASWWRRLKGRPAPAAAAIWGLRLVGLQISYVYFSTGFSKLRQERWIEGRALRDVLASPLYGEWPAYIDFWPFIYALTWGTIVFELLFPALVWLKRYRPYCIAAGVAFHAGIDLLMTIPMFSAVMIVSYACYMTDGEAKRFAGWLRHPLRRGGPAASPKKRRRRKRAAVGREGAS